MQFTHKDNVEYRTFWGGQIWIQNRKALIIYCKKLFCWNNVVVPTGTKVLRLGTDVDPE